MNEQKEKNFISAVVYFRNNADTACKSVQWLAQQLQEKFEKYEIICVDDGSDDETVQALRQVDVCRDSCIVSIVKMSGHQGVEAALSAGVDLAIGDYVFEFEKSVFDFDAQLLYAVYSKALSGYDIVSATNKAYKRASSGLFYRLFNRSAHLPTAIRSETFRLVSRRGINRMSSLGKFVKYRKALYANCGLKSANLTYMGEKRSTSRTQDSDKRTETAITSMILFTDLAYKLSVTFSLLMMAATIFMGVYTVIVYATKNAVEGFTTTMLVMCGSFFAIFGLFAIVIKYLSVLVQLVFRQQEYLVENVEKL